MKAFASLGITNKLPEKPGRESRAMQTLLNRISGQGAEVISIERELVARPALNPEQGGEGEEEKARWIETWLREKRLPPAERLDCPDTRVPSKVRPNLILRYPGSTGQTLWIVGHLDVSPPGSESLWIGSPWALRVDGDRIYGRGVEDNHQSITAGLILYEALVRERITPPMGLGLLFVAGGKQNYPRKYGIEYVLEKRPDLFQPGDMIVVNDYGNAEGSIIEIAEKGLLILKITVIGKQAHAALGHEGINALKAGADLIRDFSELEKNFPKINSIFTPDMSTFTPTRVEAGGGALNQIPGRFVFYMDCRFMAGYTIEQIENAVRDLVNTAEKRDRVAIELERVMAVPVAPDTIPTAPVVLALQEAVSAELKTRPGLVGIGAITMAMDFRHRGLPVAVWANSQSFGDAANEYILVSSLIRSAQVFTRMLFYPHHPLTGSQAETGE